MSNQQPKTSCRCQPIWEQELSLLFVSDEQEIGIENEIKSHSRNGNICSTSTDKMSMGIFSDW